MKKLLLVGALLMSLAASATADVGKIAFTSMRSGNGDIYVMNPDGSSQTNVSNTATVEEGSPGWSPNSAKIVYQRTDALWTMNANGTGQAVLFNGGAPVHPDFHPSGSPIILSKPITSDYDIAAVNADGSNLRQVLSNRYGDYFPRWSPDGSKFTFYTFDSYGGSLLPNVYVANANGTGQTRLTPEGRSQNADWSPDGGHIVFQTARDGNNEIYLMDADGSNPTRLTNNAATDTLPTFSPDGSKIAFVSNRDGNNEIYVMNADGSGTPLRLTNNAVDDNAPTWGQTLPANAPSVSINDVAVAEGNASPSNAVFSVTLSAASTAAVTVRYRTYPGSAQAGVDYTALPASTVTFAPGETSKNINVPILGDTVDENDETFSVRLSAIGANIGDQLGIATIQDDDAPPALSINDISIAEGGNGTSNATFTVTLANASTKEVIVDYATANGTATSGSDYSATNGSVTIPAGQLSATITVAIIGDMVAEVDEAFFVQLSNAVNATVADGQGQGTITDDDTQPALSINDVSITEGGTASFTVSLSRASTAPVSVDYATANGTAVQPGDYTAKTGTITIPGGQTKATITVATLNDTLIEKDETFLVNLSNVSAAVVIDEQGQGTITNNDFPEMYISDVVLREGNSSSRILYFTVALSDPAPFTTTVNYATADGTATQPGDYAARSGALIFTAGQTTKTVGVPIYGDTALEANKTFLVNLSGVSGAILVDNQGQATILNDDTVPTIRINDVSLNEGDAGTSTVNFTVTLSAPIAQDTTVQFATANNTALAGSDYIAQNGTLTISAGQTSGVITLTINGDPNSELDEVFLVNLSNAVNATIADSQGRVTILNNDAPPALSMSDVTLSEGNTGAKIFTFKVNLNVASGQKVTVNYTTLDGTAMQPGDYAAKSGTLTFLPGQLSQSVTVSVQGDANWEADETFFVNLSGAVGATIADAQGIATITNDDLSS